MKDAQEKQHYWLCNECAEKRGGVFPKGHFCTVMDGKCPYCREEKTLIPWVDFNWPKDPRKNMSARMARD